MAFDPYEEWLQIPDNRRPPGPFDLLGLSPGETDERRIRDATAARYERVRQFALGPRRNEANRILSELAQAMAALLDPASRDREASCDWQAASGAAQPGGGQRPTPEAFEVVTALPADEQNSVVATVRDMHPAMGVLADLVLPSWGEGEPKRIVARFEDGAGRRFGAPVLIDMSAVPEEPIVYLRFPGDKLRFVDEWWHRERPVLVRVCRRDRPATSRDLRWDSRDGLLTEPSAGGRVTRETVGVRSHGRFEQIIPAGTPLPHFHRRAFRTTRHNQTSIAVTATAQLGARLRTLGKVELAKIPPAPAGVPWIECTFRLDWDGRFTLTGRDPVSGSLKMSVSGRAD